MTPYELARRSIKNFPLHHMTDRNTVKHLRRQWIRSVLSLGEDWLLLKQTQRLDIPKK